MIEIEETLETGVEPVPRMAGPLAEFWRSYAQSRGALLGLAIAVMLLLLAIFAGVMAPHSPYEQFRDATLTPPAWDPGGDPRFLLGTDPVGRDILSRLIYGTRLSLTIGLISVAISLTLGIALGMVAGYLRGWAETAIMRLMDVMLAFPYLLLAMIVVAILGPSLTNAMIAIGIVYTPQFARVVRGAVLAIREQEFVEAAGAVGAGALRILARHVLPNILSPIIVMATLTVGFTIVETAGLSFLGLGASPPTPEWGSMLATGRSYMLTAPWIATFPGLAILITVVGFNLVGDGLRDLLDPRLRGRGF